MKLRSILQQQIIPLILCVSLSVGIVPLYTLHSKAYDVPDRIGETGGYLFGSLRTIEKGYIERKFNWSQGHGFAAEQANNLADRLQGKKAIIVGDNNALNGADRKIINRNGNEIWIQDKYYQSASGSVNAAFDQETGTYRYITSKGTPMMLEVPADQYEDAIRLMQDKISEGKVPGVTEPSEAVNYVRQGKYTYKQVVNLTKAGNIDSLKYDATNGAITAAGAFGISFALDFISCKMNGETTKDATKNAALNGLKTGGVVFATYVISSQLAKTGLKQALAPTTDAIANALGKDLSVALLKTVGKDATTLTASEITKQVSSILQNQIITTGVVIAVLSIDDVADLFRGRISKEQLLKNLAVTTVSVAGATVGSLAGSAAGTALAPGVGTEIGRYAGGFVGGIVSGYVGEKVLSNVYAGDAEEMYEIISAQFQILGDEYLISEAEGDAITLVLQDSLTSDVLKDMYASEDRTTFANDLMEPMFEDQIKKRETIDFPSEEEVRAEMKATMQDVVYIH